MIYLLDVNVLLALCYIPHTLHSKAMTWLSNFRMTEQPVCLATCSITELLRLAAEHGGILVTLDRGIPGASLIPEVEYSPPSVHEPFRPYGVAA